MTAPARLSGICSAASTRPARYGDLHGECRGPVTITVAGQGGGTIELPCDCTCHQKQEVAR